MTVQKQAETLMAVSVERGFSTWLAASGLVQNWVLFEQGQQTEGLDRMVEAPLAFQATGSAVLRSYNLGLVAEAYGKVGEINKGLDLLNEAMAFISRTSERIYEAELYRIKGELLCKDEHGRRNARPERSQRDGLSPEACFLQAIEVARRQESKSLELRATVSLGRLWQKQGRHEEARQRLAEIYDWFSEGFDSADLKEARLLLEELAVKRLEASGQI
jgi:predicted ATPase